MASDADPASAGAEGWRCSCSCMLLLLHDVRRAAVAAAAADGCCRCCCRLLRPHHLLLLLLLELRASAPSFLAGFAYPYPFRHILHNILADPAALSLSLFGHLLGNILPISLITSAA